MHARSLLLARLPAALQILPKFALSGARIVEIEAGGLAVGEHSCCTRQQQPQLSWIEAAGYRLTLNTVRGAVELSTSETLG